MDENVYGEYPNSPVVYAACDSKYFMDHAASFIYSANDVGKDVHVHICNPTEEVWTKSMILNADTDIKISYTANDIDMTISGDHQGRVLPEAERTYYACLRFLYLQDIVVRAGKVLALDIDCLIMKEFDFPKTAIGYFARSPLPDTTGWEQQGTKIAAGIFYIEDRAQAVAAQIKNRIVQGPFAWFLDQVALSEILDFVPENDTTLFDNNFMDWEFGDSSIIWTGKGKRKYNNLKYVEAKKNFDRYTTATTRCWA